jgi:hypothetical protein
MLVDKSEVCLNIVGFEVDRCDAQRRCGASAGAHVSGKNICSRS